MSIHDPHISFSMADAFRDVIDQLAIRLEYDAYYQPQPWVFRQEKDGKETYRHYSEEEIRGFVVHLFDDAVLMQVSPEDRHLSGLRLAYLTPEEMEIVMAYAKAACVNLSNVRNKDLLTLWQEFGLGIDVPV
jgi:hypothetical protein